MHRAILAGGTGFIGRELARALLRRGWDVDVLTRGNSEPGEAGRKPRLLHWNGTNGDGWWEQAEGATAIINLAGAGVADTRWTPARKELIRQSRVQAGQGIMDGLMRMGERPHVLLQGSAVGYYGMDATDCDESAAPGAGFLADVCREWEASTNGAEAMGLRCVVLRTGVVLGARGGALAKMLTPFRLGLGGPLGNGRQPFPWIHMKDQVGAMLHLLEDAQASGPYNLAAPGVPCQKDFARTLGRVLHRPAFLPAPGTMLKLLLGQMAAEMLLAGQAAEPQRLLASGYSFAFTDAETALRDILDGQQ